MSNIDPSTGRQKQDLASDFGPPPTSRTTGCLTGAASLYVDPLKSSLVTSGAPSAQGKPAAMISSPFQDQSAYVHQGLATGERWLYCGGG